MAEEPKQRASAGDTTVMGKTQPRPEPRTYVLEVVEGPDAGRTFPLDASSAYPSYLGKSAACELTLGDPQVSRRHLSLEVTEKGLRVRDLDSTNGTFIKDVRFVEAILRGGETLLLGGSRIAVKTGPSDKQARLDPAISFGRVVGGSVEMRRLYPLCRKLAESDVPVILEGETGTGKELVAESIHEQSRRAKGPFVVFDCTAVPANLVESALFGHERGAFTGAVGTRQGVFEQADKGTLLIDEIGDLDYAAQAKLLRALERSEVQRVGGTGWIRIDVRILCATRRDLEKEIQAGRFRDDLYYRLAVARLELPALRAREGDIELLTQHFWSSLGGEGRELPADLAHRLKTYSWPGNVRELRNAIAHRVALGELADLDTLWRRTAGTPQPETIVGEAARGAAASDIVEQALREELTFPVARERVMRHFERRYVEWVVARHAGNMTRAAAASGIARRYLYEIRMRNV